MTKHQLYPPSANRDGTADWGHFTCTHGPGVAWSEVAFLRLLGRCDTCGRLRLWARYAEVYGHRSSWWWECGSCLKTTKTDYEDYLADIDG